MALLPNYCLFLFLESVYVNYKVVLQRGFDAGLCARITESITSLAMKSIHPWGSFAEGNTPHKSSNSGSALRILEPLCGL
jgi:hypothetical protein